MGIENWSIPISNNKIFITPTMMVTIAGGFLSLWYTVSANSFRLFMIVYFTLWGVRLLLLFVGNQIGLTFIFNKNYNVDFIIGNYYRFVSRLDTPLPFIIFGLIDQLFSGHQKIAQQKQ
jgi:hypothetical protein